MARITKQPPTQNSAPQPSHPYPKQEKRKKENKLEGRFPSSDIIPAVGRLLNSIEPRSPNIRPLDPSVYLQAVTRISIRTFVLPFCTFAMHKYILKKKKEHRLE